MNWFHKICVCLFIVTIFTSYCVNAENNENIILNHGEEELIPPEQILDTNDAGMSEKKTSAQLSNTQLRQNCAPYLNGWNFGHNIGFPFGHGLIASPLVGHPLDAQASSPSNNVVLVLANEKNKLAELTKPAEESLKRLVRNPDAVDDIVEQFNLFGGNVAQRMFQQVAQTAPELSRSFGQALGEVLAQTSALAQTPPGNFNLSQLPLGVGPVIRPENFDFGQLGQRLSQSFLLGAAPNLMKSQNSENTKEAEPVTATEQAAGSDITAEAAPSLTQQNPLVGHPLLPPLNFGLPPMGIFRPLRLFNPLMPLASEISEVRVKPDEYNPYKLTPKEVDHQAMAEMRLKALLRDALAKKTIPILWFHLPSSQDVHKSSEDLETETKLKIFEKQVIAELEQLQELSKLANELKKTQLQSGSKPTPSLTTKLNLSEIPIYDITLGDIEKTLEDEHVRMLMHTITQNQNKELHRNHQATTQYLTDLTGNPIKRQTSADDVLKTMEKDDLLKMMSYAYRMAAMNGQMPWLKSEEQTQSVAMEAEKQTKMNNEGRPTDMSSQMLMQNPTNPPQRPTETINQRQMDQLMANGPSSTQQNTFPMQWTDHNMPVQRQSMMSNTEMASEKQWLEDKQRQMLEEAEKQRKINDETRTSDAQPNVFSSQSANLNMPTQSQSMMENTEMMTEKQWLADKQREMALEAELNTKTNNEGRSTDMSSQMLMQNPMTPSQRPTETANQRQIPQQSPKGKPTDTHPNTFVRQWFDQNMLSQMLLQNPTTSPHRPPPQTIMERQIPQQMLNGRPTDTHPNTFTRQWFDQNMLSQMLMQNPTTPPHRPPPQTIMERQMPQEMMTMQNPTTPPHRPPSQTIMERKMPQEMMIMQNPTTPPHRSPSQTIMEIQMPQEMMIMQNPTTPPHKPPVQTIMERQIPPQMTNGRPTDTHPNTFARQWFDQNMLSQMLMQNPTTPPHRPPPQTIMERQMPQEMMTMQNPTTPPHRPPPQTVIERQMPQEMMIMQNPTTPPHRPPPQTITQRQMPQVMINNEPWVLPMPIQPEQKQEIDAKSNSQVSATKPVQVQGADSATDPKDINPTLVETTPQTAEDADKPRFGGLKNIFDLDIFHHGKDKGKQEKPTVINYYYNTGGSRYPPVYSGGYVQPQPTPSTYYQGPAYVSKYKPSGSLYGSGGYGSNAYGSYGGGYRAAVGDEEIAVMLQQQQLLPQITIPNDDDPLTAINTTAMETDNADKINNLNKRFAKNNHNNSNNNSPAAYLVVVRDNNNSKKSRSKRSTEEFTTLEPIDENSLNALRKTYKNSLKEITLNPNETPAEALMRYKAESIREALEKANQVPMELTTDAEHYEGVKESKEAKTEKQIHNQPMPSTAYVLSANEQFKANQAAGPQISIDNNLYTAVPVPVTIPQNQPLAMAYNQQPEVVYETPQEGLYNKYVVKYNSNAAYDSNPKILPQNRYLSMFNSMDAVPYVDEYSVDNQAYQVANADDINTNSFVYPQVNSKLLNAAQAYAIEEPNAIAKEIQNYYTPTAHIMEYSERKAPEFSNYPAGFITKKNPYLFTNTVSKYQTLNEYSQLKPSQIEYSKRFNTVRTQEKFSFENLIAVIKERLTQCCNDCKNKILKSLDESLSAYSAPLPETHHTLTYRNPQVEENFEYKHWLMEMAEKGYDKSYLTNRHQEEYLKDGRLNLHITTENGYGQEEDKKFFKNNQSYKRETTEPNMEEEVKTEVVIASIKTDNSLEKETNEAGDYGEDQEEAEKEMIVEELQPDVKEKEKKLYTKRLNNEESISKIEKVDIKSNENQTTKLQFIPNSENNTKPVGTSESTTHSIYAMRGQFRPQKQRPQPFSMVQAKHFDNYKHINKIGKTEDQRKRTEKSDKVEEILILLPKTNHEEETITPNNRQVTVTESNLISKVTSNETNSANKPKKIISKKQKTSSTNQMSTQNSSESNNSTESIG